MYRMSAIREGVTTNMGEFEVPKDEIVKIFCTQIAADLTRLANRHVTKKVILPEGISNAHMQVLLAIFRYPGATTPTIISKALCLDKSSITRRISQLEDAKLISVSMHMGDLRSKAVILTETGLDICHQYNEKFSAVVTGFEDYYGVGFADEEMDEFIKALRVIARRTYLFSTHKGASPELSENTPLTNTYRSDSIFMG